MKHLGYVADDAWCDCEVPNHDGEKWVAVGTLSKSIMDFKLCATCGKPIRGTATTHDA